MEKTNKKSKSKYVVIGIIIAVAIAGAISANSMVSSNTELKTAPTDTTVEGLQLGNIAPGFSLADPQKGTITKQSFEGKPLFIFFTATYCTPCQIGAQNLGRYDDETGGKAFNVLIVFVDERESDNQFIEWKNKFGKDDWHVAKGIDMAKTYQVQYLDTKYVFDKNGIIKWIDIKPLDYPSIDPVMRPLLET
ncbi:MAG: TlpA family protein disulfide reductase [Nitrosopumilaceae archaeon]